MVFFYVCLYPQKCYGFSLFSEPFLPEARQNMLDGHSNYIFPNLPNFTFNVRLVESEIIFVYTLGYRASNMGCKERVLQKHAEFILLNLGGLANFYACKG